MIDLACAAFYLTATGSISLWIRRVAGESNSKTVSCLQQGNEEAMQQVSVQSLVFQSLYEGNRSLQSHQCSSSSWMQGLKPQVPTQLDPEVALTPLGRPLLPPEATHGRCWLRCSAAVCAEQAFIPRVAHASKGLIP